MGRQASGGYGRRQQNEAHPRRGCHGRQRRRQPGCCLTFCTGTKLEYGTIRPTAARPKRSKSMRPRGWTPPTAGIGIAALLTKRSAGKIAGSPACAAGSSTLLALPSMCSALPKSAIAASTRTPIVVRHLGAGKSLHRSTSALAARVVCPRPIKATRSTSSATPGSYKQHRPLNSPAATSSEAP